MSGAADGVLSDIRILVSALEEIGVGREGLTSDSRLGIGADAATRRVALAAELKTLVDQALQDCVEQARADQVSWQQIGDVLGISRQAAFQRFRNPDDPRGTSHMRTKTNNDLIPKAESVYRRIEAGDYAAVGAEMTFLVQRALTEEKVMGVWSEARAMVGTLESLGASFVRPSGRSAVVVETPLIFEAGDLVGRIAYNKRDKIVGMLILRPEDLPSAPF